jgi:hypothetical protein
MGAAILLQRAGDAGHSEVRPHLPSAGPGQPLWLLLRMPGQGGACVVGNPLFHIAATNDPENLSTHCQYACLYDNSFYLKGLL